MKTASVSELKRELSYCNQKELIEICLRLSKHKKENKELLTYLIYEASDEEQYIKDVCEEMSCQFKEINTTSYYYIKKSVRKILSFAKKKIRFSKQKETEVSILLHFCLELRKVRPSFTRNTVLVNMFSKQLELAEKALQTLHEDLQYDYQIVIDRVKG